MDLNEPQLFSLPGRSSWGRCVLVRERDGKLFLHGEDGGEHIVATNHRATLRPLQLGVDVARSIVDEIARRRGANAAGAEVASRRETTAGASSAHQAWDAQIARFEARFPGGFRGARYTSDERGVSGDTSKRGDKEALVERSRVLLSRSTFRDPGAVYHSARTLIGATNLVSPVDGAVPLRAMRPHHQRAFSAALLDLLHGKGEYEVRFDQFVANLRVEDAAGAATCPSWPLATAFSALFLPVEHICIKPRFMQSQAAVLGLSVTHRPLPTGAAYAQHLSVARKLQQKLIERGHQPRDLVDVALFIWSTAGGAEVSHAGARSAVG